MLQRYAKQINFRGFGHEGQKLLSNSKVLIVGCGALGTVVANNLVRAGVGTVRIVDRDFVELSNLHRQILFTEEDAANSIPKAIAAQERLQAANSDVVVEGFVEDVNSLTIGKMVEGIDLIVDCTDNFITRFLINDAAFAAGIPWIYGGVVGGSGVVYSFIPGATACLRCMMTDPPGAGAVPTCDTGGVLNTITGIVGNHQTVQAMKLLVHRAELVSDKMLFIDIWYNSVEYVPLHRSSDCPCCARGEYKFLMDTAPTAISLCGQNHIQVDPRLGKEINLEALYQRLIGSGIDAKLTSFMLSINAEGYELRVFSDGRALIKNAGSLDEAKTIYSRVVGW